MNKKLNHLKKPPAPVKHIKGGPLSNGQIQKPRPVSVLFSPRQTKIAELIASGLSDKEIANEIGLAEGTVGQYLNNMFKKRRIHSRSALATLFHQEWGNGLQSPRNPNKR
jgi:DNA-binding NarL/FixJ family response regulator